LVIPDGREWLARGEVEGRIADGSRGTGGFGYDPLFIPAGYECTFAEMTSGEKNEISHRTRAFQTITTFLEEI
jgi:XTP/dITP diphosphohydrolase